MLLLLKHRMTTKSKSPCLIYQLSNLNDRFWHVSDHFLYLTRLATTKGADTLKRTFGNFILLGIG